MITIIIVAPQGSGKTIIQQNIKTLYPNAQVITTSVEPKVFQDAFED